MASFLHATDLHFGAPPNSVGVGKSFKYLWTARALPPRGALRTVMATHDRDVALALTDLIGELKDQVDSVLLTGDIATTGTSPSLSAATDWLARTTGVAQGKQIIALAGNHDRFHGLTYAPGGTLFDATLGSVPSIVLPAPPHGVGTTIIGGNCLVACVDLTLINDSEATRRGGTRAQGVERRADRWDSERAA